MTEWQPIETAPKDGTRIKVKHERSNFGSRLTTPSAVWLDNGWACSELFIDPHTMQMYREPTHWAPYPITK